MTKNYKVFYCNALMYNFSIEKIIPWACDLMIQWGVFTKLKWCSILEVKEAWKEVFSLASFMPLPNMICELIASWCFQALNLHSKHHDAFKGKTLNTIVKMCARCKTAYCSYCIIHLVVIFECSWFNVYFRNFVSMF